MRTFPPLGAAALLIGGGLLIAPATGSAQTTPYEQINIAAAASPVTTQPLRDGVALLQGSGGNIGVVATPDGTFLVDTGIAVSKAKIQAAIAALGGGPVRLAVNTHWHWDHADGNGWVRAGGGHVLARPATIAHLSDTIRVAEWSHTFRPNALADLPDRPVKATTRLSFGTQRLSIKAYPDSHTDGDLIVRLLPADILFTGDTWWNGVYPFIDYVAGGSIDGMIRAADWTIAQTGPHTIIVPGHGPAGGLAELTAYRDMLVTVRDRVAALKKTGKSLAETIDAHPTSDLDGRLGQSLISPALFVTLVYRGV